MPRMSTAEATVETLLRHGLDTIYALPGLHQDPLFDAFYHASDRLRVIHPRHEQMAAYMALGAALVTGKPQAFAVVPGPGMLNAGAALLTAYGMNAPVIGLIGQIPQADIDRGHGHLHEIHDQLGMMRTMLEGVDLSENGQAMDAIREVGPGAHFLGCAHTQANFETAFFRSTIADNNTYEQWLAEGERDAATRASVLVKRMLNEYEAPAIDPAVDEALLDFIARKKASFPDSNI